MTSAPPELPFVLREDRGLTDYCTGLLGRGPHESPGLLVAVARGGELRYGCSGLADLEHRIPLGPSTRFEIGSIAKQITSRALLTALGEESALDAPVTALLPDATHLAAVTLRQLADHDASVPDYDTLLALSGRRVWDYWSQADVRRLILRQPVHTDIPWHYSNSHHLLLAEALRERTGRSLAAFARDLVFPVYGMRQSSFRAAPEELIVERARSYYRDSRSRDWRLADTSDATIGPHGLYSSLTDLVAWEHAIRSDDTSIDAELLKKSVALGRQSWVLGRTARRHRRSWLFGHGGSRFGFRSALWSDGSGTTVAVLAAREDIDADRVADDVRDLDSDPGGAVPVTVPAVRHPQRSSPSARPRDGIYWSCGDGSEWQLRTRGDRVVVTGGQGEISLRQSSEGAWIDDRPAVRLTTVGDEGDAHEGKTVEITQADGFLLTSLEYVGTGAAGTTDGPDSVVTYIQVELGTELTWRVRGARALAQTGRALHQFRQVGADCWLGGGMRVRRWNDQLIVDLPRARNIVFCRKAEGSHGRSETQQQPAV
ncbi:serine hydrolase domain-containing protein [Streptomyces canus]|uniref:serine hydrolase domain-containing protein n=1 Tax=Streptomyces canus TaxID=58343 RepID=UPI00369857C1